MTEQTQVSKEEFNKLTELVTSMKSDMEKLKTQLNERVTKSLLNELEGRMTSHTEFNKLNESIVAIKSDMEKIKPQIVDKVPKAVLSELEGNLNNHSKLIESFSNKLYELQNNLNTFTQKPVTQIMIETIRRHLTEEIMANVNAMFNDYVDKTNNEIIIKHDELKQIIQNTKRFVFVK